MKFVLYHWRKVIVFLMRLWAVATVCHLSISTITFVLTGTAWNPLSLTPDRTFAALFSSSLFFVLSMGLDS